jgi:hypothetical protein
LRKRLQLALFLVLAVVAAASMWFYATQILRARQIADAEIKQIPRGNLSDLYPRWLGTRELLLRHRNPYSREVTLEIQEGYYGRRLDPSRPNDPRDQQGFAYPVYVVFLLAPLSGIAFPVLRIAFYWLLAVLTAASVWLWLRTLRWRLHPLAVGACMALTLGSFAAVQGIKLQQLSLLVAALLSAASACVACGFLFLGGALLALATIKPQLAWPLAAWLLLWAVGDWRSRRRLALGFGLIMALLLAGAEIILPGWWRMFAQAVAQYRQYTQNQSVIEVILNEFLGPVASGAAGRTVAQILAAIAVLACAAVLWKLRRQPADTKGFSAATALALALTVLVVPMYAPYNQVLLLPAILLLARERAVFQLRSLAGVLAYWVGAFVVGWQWAASLCLTAIYYLASQTSALDRWTWPFFATFALPVWVFALTLFLVKHEPRKLPEALR